MSLFEAGYKAGYSQDQFTVANVSYDDNTFTKQTFLNGSIKLQKKTAYLQCDATFFHGPRRGSLYSFTTCIIVCSSGQRCSHFVEFPSTQCGLHVGFPPFLCDPVKRRRSELIEGAQRNSESSSGGEDEDEDDASEAVDNTSCDDF